MTDDQRSAEKDLLKLIENPGEAEAQKKALDESRPAPAAAGKKKARGFSLFSFAKKGPAEVSHAPSRGLAEILLDRRTAIRALALLTVIIFGYFIATAFTEYSKLQKTKNFEKFNYIFEGKEQNAPKTVLTLPSDTPAVEEKEPAIRNIFKPWAQRQEEGDVPGGNSGSAIKDFKLVGISLTEDVKDSYAMVENSKTGITFFLKKGEKLAGMELLDITENKLIFKEGGKSVELR